MNTEPDPFASLRPTAPLGTSADATREPSAPGTEALSAEAPTVDEPATLAYRATPEVEPVLAGAPTVPGHDILGVLGKGGMGVVYRARQQKLRRVVALKMIRDASAAGPEDLARFQTEAEALASLQHPNIVQIYEVGESDGLPYFSLEYVEGGNLAKKLARTPQPARWSAEMLETLARAVEAAHRKGIIHRDLKPVNVLLTPDGTPKITDFGLAKQLDQDSGQTQSGAIMGTPSYMAPEQARGQVKDVGPLSDVWALGVILYEMITGRLPFLGESLTDTMLLVATSDPVPPGQLQPKLPRDLETICLKCLQKEPRKRYASAGELADDLRRFLDGEPIRARPVSRWEKAIKWVRRRPTLAAAVSLSLLCLVAVVLGTILVFQEKASKAELQLSETERFLAQSTRAQDLLAEGEQHVRDSRWDAARRVLESALNVMGNEPRLAERRQHAEALLSQARAGLKTAVDREHFLHCCDDVLFYSSEFTGLDRPANVQKADEAARAGLTFFGLNDGPAVIRSNPNLDDAEKNRLLERGAGLYLILARSALQHGEGDKAPLAQAALALLDRAAGLRPPGAAEFAQRAECLTALGDESGAAQARQNAARLTEEVRTRQRKADAADVFLFGLQQYERGDLDGAAASFDGTLRESPEHFWAEFYLAVCYLRTRQPAQARASLTACLNRRKDFIWTYLLRGYTYGELGAQHRARREPQQAEVCFDAAERDFEKALQMKPSGDEMYVLLVNRGVSRFYAQNADGAVADLQEAIRQKPDRFQAYDNLAHVFKDQKQTAAAIETLTRAIALKPSVLASLYRTRAGLYADQKDTAAALADLDEAIRREPPGSPLLAEDHFQRGRLFAADKHYEPALGALDTALKLNPTHTGAHRLRAETLLQLSRYEEAVRAYDSYLANHGRPSAEVYRVRGLASQHLGNYAGAIEDYTRALTLRTDDVPSLTQRGWAYLVSDVPRLAFRDFQEVVDKDPDNADAYNGRGMARAKLGQLAAAAQDAEEAVKRAPTEMRVLYNAARLCAQLVRQFDTDPTQRGPMAAELRSRYQDRSIDLLRAALEQMPSAERRGYWQLYIAKDRAFDPVRRASRFLGLARDSVGDNSSREPMR